MGPSHYQNKCWVVIDEALWNLVEDSFLENIPNIFYFKMFRIAYLKIRLRHFGGNELICHCRRWFWSCSQRHMNSILHWSSVCFSVMPTSPWYCLSTDVWIKCYDSSDVDIASIADNEAIQMISIIFNSLWPTGAICWHPIMSALAQKIAYYLTISYDLNQCWLLTSKAKMTIPWG